MTFSAELRTMADDLWQKSIDHPFVRELADGSLPIAKFAHYLKNDSYYLTTFARVQSLAAAMAPDLHTLGRLAYHAQMTVEAEEQLHETFFAMLGLEKDPNFVAAPTACQYASHLSAVCSRGSLADVIAAILPCYWLYFEIGQTYKDARPNREVYQRWIDTYSDEWFSELVQEQISRLDELTAHATVQEKQSAARAFLISSHYEHQFWEMAYRLEKWDFEETANGQKHNSLT